MLMLLNHGKLGCVLVLPGLGGHLIQVVTEVVQGRGQLLAAELISQPGGIHHGAGGLLLGQPHLVAHLVQVALELPPGGGDGLVDIAELWSFALVFLT